MDAPFFSVLISAYNRAGELPRCVGSCSAQTFADFEIVVVDDGSTDDTGSVLARLGESRLRVVRHERNRGISAARETGVEHGLGSWYVILDSDWELMPEALARLHELIAELPEDVHIIRSRLRSDDGTLEPGVMPAGVTGYQGRLEWCEAVAAARVASDAGHCIHRSVFERAPYFSERSGAVETLWELNVARTEKTLWVDDVLGLQHTDAANSHIRDLSARRLIPRLLGEAPDTLWMVETLLAEHDAALVRFAPHYRRDLVESAALQAFLAGRRGSGLRHTADAIRSGASARKALMTAAAGVLGPRALAYAKVAGRVARARRRAASQSR
jgi:glycosyltransferase involved in cell wall biosynthesis